MQYRNISKQDFQLKIFETFKEQGLELLTIDVVELTREFTDYYISRRRVASYNKIRKTGLIHLEIIERIKQEVFANYIKTRRDNASTE